MWDPTPIDGLSHGSSLDGNDPLASLHLWDLIYCSVFLESQSLGTTSLIWGGEVIWSAGMYCGV